MNEFESRFSQDKFKSVSECDSSPIYSWIWNSEITRELIKTQIDEMYDAGMRALYILPEPKEFRPSSMRTYMTPEYLSEEFFSLVRYAVDYAASKGMGMWLYDEGGWPSGGACGQVIKKYPDGAAKIITEVMLDAEICTTVSKDDYICAFSEDFAPVRLPYTFSGKEKLYGYKCTTLHGMADSLNENAVEEFISGTYEKYRKYLGDDFGKTATAIFTDEPVAAYPPFISDKEEFKSKTGFEFDAVIPALFGHFSGEESASFKLAYMEYIHNKFDEKYMIPLRDWCRKNNIHLTGHMDGDHQLCDYKKQVGGCLGHLRNMDIPGVDVILRQIFPGNKDNTFFSRLASSAANQIGEHLALTESFAVYGDGITFDQMRYVANYQFVRGINLLNIMSVTSGRDRCLSSQCRPHFVPELPTNEYMSVFNEYISRMMYLCKLGQTEVDTALYMPVRDAWVENKEAEESYTQLGRLLEENGIYFDIIDDEFLCKAKCENGTLSMGNAVYKSVYLPKTRYISKKALTALDSFEKNGGGVYTDCRLHTKGTVKCDNPNIRVMKKKAGEDTLYFIFNESDEPQKIAVCFFEEKNGYALNCRNGNIEELSDSFTLQSGDMQVFLFTARELFANSSSNPSHFEEITDFKVDVIKVVEFDGERFVAGKATPSRDFSGTVKYTASFCGKGKNFLELCGVRDCATVVINGEEVARLAMSPYTVRLDRGLLKDDNVLEIYVSNTAAAACVAADYSNTDPVATGPYNGITLEYEKDNAGIGLDKIRLGL